MTREAFSEFLTEHGLVFGLLADESGNVLARAGDIDAPDFHWLSSNDPPWVPTSPEQVRHMIERLNGQLLPQMVSQGHAVALLMRPCGKFLAVFGVRSSGKDATWAYHHAKVVSSSLEAGLSGEVQG
jgi:hypothetical protein